LVTRFEVAHSGAGLAELIARLADLAPASELPIAIERPSGQLVDTLIEAGHPIVPIHPNLVKACRPRYRAAGGKSDPGDAYLLAAILRTDGHRFGPLRPCADEIKALRAPSPGSLPGVPSGTGSIAPRSMVRGRDDLVAQRVARANQLRALRDGFWPGALAIFADIDRRGPHAARGVGWDSPIALACGSRYPTPDSAARLGPQRWKAVLAQHRYGGRRTAADLLERLRAAPQGLAGDAETDAKRELVRARAAVRQTLVAELAKLTARIEHAVAELADGRIIMSCPRAGRICAAQILAELGRARARFSTEQQLAAAAGVGPVTHRSGKSRGVVFRYACNHRLRRAVTCRADHSRHACACARAIYQRARAQGCDHPHAVRILARAWVRVLWRAWYDQTASDPAKHRAADCLPQPARG
jgi:transposase